MTELYENPACSKREMNRLLNAHLQLNDISLISIRLELCDLIGSEISIDHVKTIINSWAYYQALINMSYRTDLEKLKDKINDFITIRNEVLQELFDYDVAIFEQSSEIFSAFGLRDNILEFLERLNRKNGTPYSKDKLIKQSFFELLFIGESLGLVPSSQFYQRSELKSFLRIITNHLFEYEITDKTLEFYCQKYSKAKNKPKTKEMAAVLIKQCIQIRSNVLIWQKLLTIYQDQIAPLMLAP